MPYVVKVDLSSEGMGELTTVAGDGNPRLFATKKEAEEFQKLIWPEKGFVEEVE